MITFDQQALKQRLLAEGYSDFSARMIVETLDRIDEQLNEALNTWIETGTIINFEVEGINIQKIMKETRTNFCSALFIMTMFIRDPEKTQTFFDTPLLYR